MPIDSTLLKILVCPETKESVAMASSAILNDVNARIARGEVKTTKGAKVEQSLTEALIRSDGKRLYPIVNGIPVMMIDEGINL